VSVLFTPTVERVECGPFLVGQSDRRLFAVGESLRDVGGYGGGHIDMDAEQSGGSLARHCVGDDRSPVTTLGHIMLVSQTVHQYGPGARNAVGSPACALRLAREPIARDRGQDEVEGILRPSPVGRGVGERADDLQEF
jgi:hypothetical protein